MGRRIIQHYYNKIVFSKLPNYCTVFQGEMMAIYQTLKTAPVGERLVIYTDSLSGLQALRNWKNSTDRIISSIIKQIKSLEDHPTEIYFHWVKGHNNVPGNEAADQLAKTAAKEATQQAAKPNLQSYK